MDRKKAFSAGLLILVLLALVAGAGRTFAPLYPGKKEKAGNRQYVGVIYLEGVIAGGRGQNSLLTAVSGTDSVIRQLREAREDPQVAAVVLRINSPGGSAAASQEVYTEAMRLRDSGKPLVASFGDVSASGGYWIACAADRIVANPATMTGSIGVIMEVANLVELYDKLGVEFETVKSGEHKDMGSASRPLKEEERAILQAMVNDIFDQFVDVVATGRGLKRAEVVRLADGRIFTGRQALELGLVDQLGDFYDAVDLAGELGKVSGRPRIKELGRRGTLERLFGGTGLKLHIPSGWPLRSLSDVLVPR